MTVDELIGQFGAESGETFEFTVAGEKMKALVCADATEIFALARQAEKWGAAFEKGHYPSDEVKEYAKGASSQVVKMAVYCEALMVDPKMDLVSGLKMGRKCGLLLPQIFEAVMAGTKGVILDKELEEFDDAKNGSGETAGTKRK